MKSLLEVLRYFIDLVCFMLTIVTSILAKKLNKRMRRQFVAYFCIIIFLYLNSARYRYGRFPSQRYSSSLKRFY